MSEDFKLKISSSPNIHHRCSTPRAMWLVIFALFPTVLTGGIFFGWKQLIIIAVSVLFSV